MAAATELEVGRVIGVAVPRKEDAKLLCRPGRVHGQPERAGNGVDGARPQPVRARAHRQRRPVRRARGAGRRRGVSAARSSPTSGRQALPCAWIPTEDTNHPTHRPLATDKARHVGDGVAVVVATSRAAAKDAAELVQVEYEPLPVVVDAEDALAPDAPLVHDDFETNRCYTWALNAGEVDEAFANADVVVTERYRHQRLIPNAIEPRGVLVKPIPATGQYTLWTSTQVPHIARVTLSVVTGIPETKLRVIAPDVGGGFGSKLNVYAEEALALAIARRLGKPVKWIEERSEAYVATTTGATRSRRSSSPRPRRERSPRSARA